MRILTSYIVFSDNSGNADKKCIDTISEKLSSAGHSVDSYPVDPNSEHLLWDGKAKGKIAIFIVNGAPIVTMISFRDAIKGKGLADKVIFAFPRTLSPNNDYTTEEALKTKKLHGEPGINTTSAAQKELENGGKFYSVAEFCEANSEYVAYVYGDTCEDVAQSILDGNFGSSSDSDDSSSESSDGEVQIMSGWESLCDLVKPYDGEILLLVRGDTVVCKKIEIPSWSAIWAYEGINVVDDSVTITDYSPEIYNTVEVFWGNDFQNKTTLCFERHKELFGERKTSIQATKKVSQYEYEEYQKSLESDGEEYHSTTETHSGSGEPTPVTDTHSTAVNMDYPNPTFTPPTNLK